MDTVILLSIVLFWLCLFIGLGNLFKYSREKESLKLYMSEVALAGLTSETKKTSFVKKLIKHLSKYADDLSNIGERINFMSESADIKLLLEKSGNPFELSVNRFQGFKIVCVFGGLLLGSFCVIMGLPLSNIALVAYPVLGFFVPIILIKSTVKKRQQQLRKDLPDFLDTVSISLQAGSGLDSAIKETIKYFSGPIRQEFSKYIHEIELGVPREKAYEEILRRNDNPEFQGFIKTLIQGQRLGVPIASTFQAQSDEIRRISLEQVKERAAKASPKVTLIISLLIAPLIMITILGLVILNMIYGDNNIFSLL
ncbi:type II secretion system F family protein [Heyndrickxia sp. NPDC080065]|uniref:type II secretion system F family protein n=1 Tax=Heyndrickxia sp. NPDC080065 TaxID=3390568 RepID=UPI003D0142C6